MSQWKYNELVKPTLGPLPDSRTQKIFRELMNDFGDNELLNLNYMTYRGKPVGGLRLTNEEVTNWLAEYKGK